MGHDFVEIVPPLGLDRADEEFRQWLRTSGVDEATLSPDDIRMDFIRSEQGRTLKRYMVRKSFLEEGD